jgi:hypothetical protein
MFNANDTPVKQKNDHTSESQQILSQWNYTARLNLKIDRFQVRFFPTLSSSLEYSFFTWNLSIFRPYLAVFSH